MNPNIAAMSWKNIVFALVTITIVFVIAIWEGWLKTNIPWFYPFRWALFGIAIATGNLLNVLPGQVEAENTSGQPVGRRAVTFLGWVVFTVLLFWGFDWVGTNYPQHAKTLRFAVLFLLFLGWQARARYFQTK